MEEADAPAVVLPRPPNKKHIVLFDFAQRPDITIHSSSWAMWKMGCSAVDWLLWCLCGLLASTLVPPLPEGLQKSYAMTLSLYLWSPGSTHLEATRWTQELAATTDRESKWRRLTPPQWFSHGSQ